jgi:RNA polymerase sigma-B factor
MLVTAPSRSTVTRRRDEQLLAAHAATRDPRLRAQLVERYMPLARYAASRLTHAAEQFEDLVQVAAIGLLNAIDRFDPGRGTAFSSYALPTINGELRRHLRDRSWAVRPPRDLQEDALRVERGADRLRAERGRPATVEELAAEVDMTVEAVLEAREAATARFAASLSSTAAEGGDDDGVELAERLGTVDEGFARAEERVALDALTRVLTTREREIVRLRFWEDCTQAEIGAAVGLSQMHVSRLLRAALAKLTAAADAAARPMPALRA